MVEIYFFFVTTIMNTSPFLDWLFRVIVPVDAVSMWLATATPVPTSLNESDALSFPSISQFPNLRQITDDFSILDVMLPRQIVQYKFLERL